MPQNAAGVGRLHRSLPLRHPCGALGLPWKCAHCSQEPRDVDVIVTEIPNEKSWGLTDLLGRDMGRVTEAKAGTFLIHPAGNAVETFAVIDRSNTPRSIAL